MKKYYNTPCSIYRLGTSTVRGSQVQTKTALYTDIKCAFWKKTENYNQTTQAIQTNEAKYTVNLEAKYNEVAIGDIIVINNKTYKVIIDPVPHEKANGQIDNYELYIDVTTEST